MVVCFLGLIQKDMEIRRKMLVVSNFSAGSHGDYNTFHFRKRQVVGKLEKYTYYSFFFCRDDITMFGFLSITNCAIWRTASKPILQHRKKNHSRECFMEKLEKYFILICLFLCTGCFSRNSLFCVFRRALSSSIVLKSSIATTAPLPEFCWH